MRKLKDNEFNALIAGVIIGCLMTILTMSFV